MQRELDADAVDSGTVGQQQQEEPAPVERNRARRGAEGARQPGTEVDGAAEEQAHPDSSMG